MSSEHGDENPGKEQAVVRKKLRVADMAEEVLERQARACDNCGHLLLFDAETIGIRGLWAGGVTCNSYL